MGFGEGSSKSPLNDDGEKNEGETESSEPVQTIPSESPQHSEQHATSQPTGNGSMSTPTGDGQRSTQEQPNRGPNTKALADIDINNRPSLQELAEMLMADAYHEENPQVPYAMWRNGTSTGRDRITIELNSEVGDLEMVAMREFKKQYDAEINKADLREFALTYGLMHADELFEIAEEWGLQYNS